MRANLRFKIIPILTSLIFGGCATFNPGLGRQDLTRARPATVQEAQEGLQVSIEEFASAEKSERAFDADVASYGVLPLLVRVENKGTETYRVSQGAIAASLNNQPLPLVHGGEAASQAATREYVGKTLGWIVLTGPFLVVSGPLSLIAVPAHTHTVNTRIKNHFANLEFRDGLLKPNQSAAGFLYFKLPENVTRLENLTVRLEASEEKDGKKLLYELAIPSLEISRAGSGSRVRGDG